MSAGGQPARRALVALETSSPRPSVAARLPGGELLEEQLAAERAHASDLLPALERLLGELSVAPAGIELVVVGTGPGSYTGLRVGVATALGLARGAGAELFGVPSPEALAYAVLAPGESGAFLLDARQGQLYLARYRREAQGVHVLRAPCVTTAPELPRLLPPGERVFADAAALQAAGLDPARARDPDHLVTGARSRAGALLELGVGRHALEGAHDPSRLEPLYLRAFAARARAQPGSPSDPA